MSKFKVGDRVKVRFGIDAGHFGAITNVSGDDGTYYGLKLDCHDKEVGYSEYELADASNDVPAWLLRFEDGNCNLSPFTARQIAEQAREWLLYKRACESMARQFICPRMTAKELAETQLKGVRDD